jgi:hypothetical protein
MPAMAKARESRFLENFTSVLVGCLLGGVIWLSNLGATVSPSPWGNSRAD